jgi:hypothetical protein
MGCRAAARGGSLRGQARADGIDLKASAGVSLESATLQFQRVPLGSSSECHLAVPAVGPFESGPRSRDRYESVRSPRISTISPTVRVPPLTITLTRERGPKALGGRASIEDMIRPSAAMGSTTNKRARYRIPVGYAPTRVDAATTLRKRPTFAYRGSGRFGGTVQKYMLRSTTKGVPTVDAPSLRSQRWILRPRRGGVLVMCHALQVPHRYGFL